jgi:predicted amidophosphoribosyltransferase
MERLRGRGEMAQRKVMPNTCPGLDRFVRPTVTYVKCPVCGGDVEIWSDEETGTCLNCGSEWRPPEREASCLEYCEYAEKCKELIRNLKH